MSTLWYDKPAKIWEEALPIGNGRMGAMIFGAVDHETIQLNEESIWYGGKMERNNPDTLKYLPKIRELIFSGQIKEAEKLMALCMSGCPESMHPYQTLGEIKLEFEEGEYTGYKRFLDIDNAVAGVEYVSDGIKYKRTVFASAPADCIMIGIDANKPGNINFRYKLTRGRYFNGVKKVGNDGVCLYGDLGKYGEDFCVVARVKTVGGKIEIIGENVIVSGADKAYIYIGADSTFHGENDFERVNATLSSAMEGEFRTLLAEHVHDYKNYFTRTSLFLDGMYDNDNIPTDVRLQNVSEGKDDIGLVPLYFDFGRYLLISCSRPGGLPATLQGLWNKDFTPPWDSKYTININAEMNYWPAEICNLSECHMPLFELIKKMVPNGRTTAREMYGCNGFVAHHNTNHLGDTAVQDIWIPGSFWVLGAAWLCTHQWTHYLYTNDIEFLKESFPIMRESAEFFLDFLVESDGYLVTCPSVSPENTYILPNGEKGANTSGCTMDNQIIRDLFDQCIKAAKVLGIEDELNERIKSAKERLIPTRIGSKGTILEWRDEYEELDPGHRHISHLYGLFPSNQINVTKTPELAKAARKTLESRLKSGGGHTGWSRAWIINHYAKLRDGNEAYENFRKLLEISTYPNMFDKHPPFQIDGNFGATAAIANMLLFSDEDEIVLLPALPDSWKNGYVKGLRAVGNVVVDVFWKDGKLAKYKITALSDISKTVRYGERSETECLMERHLEMKAGDVLMFDAD